MHALIRAWSRRRSCSTSCLFPVIAHRHFDGQIEPRCNLLLSGGAAGQGEAEPNSMSVVGRGMCLATSSRQYCNSRERSHVFLHLLGKQIGAFELPKLMGTACRRVMETSSATCSAPSTSGSCPQARRMYGDLQPKLPFRLMSQVCLHQPVRPSLDRPLWRPSAHTALLCSLCLWRGRGSSARAPGSSLTAPTGSWRSWSAWRRACCNSRGWWRCCLLSAAPARGRRTAPPDWAAASHCLPRCVQQCP